MVDLEAEVLAAALVAADLEEAPEVALAVAPAVADLEAVIAVVSITDLAITARAFLALVRVTTVTVAEDALVVSLVH